jgi:hypothetical protein
VSVGLGVEGVVLAVLVFGVSMRCVEDREGCEVISGSGDCDVAVEAVVGVGVDGETGTAVVDGALPILHKTYQSVFSCLPQLKSESEGLQSGW